MNIRPAPSVQEVLAVLPQTQCTRCGYPDCQAYASAIVKGEAGINQCPPGGQEGVHRLAQLTGHESKPLNPDHGIEGARHVVWIDENWCIGCTLCIKACPVDAIVGANKMMHTVVEALCTGCELCIPVCPVDCILTENASGEATGWQAWSTEQANEARERYAAHQSRQASWEQARADRHLTALESKSKDITAHSQIQDPEILEKKKSVIEQALARARAKAQVKP